MNSHPDPDGAVKGYYVYYRMTGLNDSLDKLDVVGANTTSYIVENLKKFTEYEFQIVAYNQYDEGNASEIFSCQTEEDGTYVIWVTFEWPYSGVRSNEITIFFKLPYHSCCLAKFTKYYVF